MQVKKFYKYILQSFTNYKKFYKIGRRGEQISATQTYHRWRPGGEAQRQEAT